MIWFTRYWVKIRKSNGFNKTNQIVDFQKNDLKLDNMVTTLNKKGYQQLITGNIMAIEKYFPECSLEKKHIIDVLNWSTKRIYDDHNMPSKLTAENGAKDLLRGEFYELFDPDETGHPTRIPISWNNIKKIYNKIVDHYDTKF